MSSVTNALQLQQKYRSCIAFIKIMFSEIKLRQG
jgi:hypothetical protein